VNNRRCAPGERPATIHLWCVSSRNNSLVASGGLVAVFITLGFLSTSNFRGTDESLYSIIMPFECVRHLSVLGIWVYWAFVMSFPKEEKSNCKPDQYSVFVTRHYSATCSADDHHITSGQTTHIASYWMNSPQTRYKLHLTQWGHSCLLVIGIAESCDSLEDRS